MLLSILHLIGQDRSWSRDDHIVFLGGDLDSSAAPRSNVTSWTHTSLPKPDPVDATFTSNLPLGLHLN